MQKLNKNQKAQVVILGGLAVGLFGTFAVQMVKVTPAAAKTHAPSTETTSTSATHGAPGESGKSVATGADGVKTATAGSTDDPSAALLAPPPTPDMRDPFIPAIADDAAIEAYRKSLEAPKTESAHGSAVGGNSTRRAIPPAAPLPKLSGFENAVALPRDLSAAPLPKVQDTTPAPSWTVTGIVEGVGGAMAILRNGDARRMVHAGDIVDDVYRVARIDRSRVTLVHDGHSFPLVLGARPVTPTQPSTTSPAPASTGPSQATAAPSAAEPDQLINLPGGLKLPAVQLPAN